MQLGYLKAKSRGFEAVWSWEGTGKAVCDDIVGMGDVAFAGLKLNGEDLAFAREGKETAAGDLGLAPVRDGLRRG